MVAQGAFRLIFPRQGKQRTGEGAGASRRPALIVSPAWPGNGRGKRRGSGRARWLAWRGLAKQAPCADSRPQRRGRRRRGRDRCAASPSLPSPCSLPFSPFPFYFPPSPLRGLGRFAPKQGGAQLGSLRPSRASGSLFMAPAAFLSLRPSGVGAAESGESGPNKKRQVGAMAATCRDGGFGRRRRGQLAFFLASSSASLPFSFASCSSCWRRWATYRLSKLMPVGSWTGGKPARRSMLVTVS